MTLVAGASGTTPTWRTRMWSTPTRTRETQKGPLFVFRPNGTVRIEHCMTYPLGGGIHGWIQDHLFHRGHTSAYFDEWAAAMSRLAEEVEAGPALTDGRSAA